MNLISPENWNQTLLALPMPHFLQTAEWAQVKSRYGWQSFFAVWEADGEEESRRAEASRREAAVETQSDVSLPHSPAAAALILERTLILGGFSMPLRVIYVPKGPNMDWHDPALRARVLDDLQGFARRRRAIFLKVDPDVPLGWGEPSTPQARGSDLGAALTAELRGRGWRFSREQIQFRNTVLIDISPPEDEILARMKQKTRYNIRLAGRRGVEIRLGTEADWPLLYRMYAETAARDGFTIRPEAYYRTVWEIFGAASETPSHPGENRERGQAHNLIAEVEGEPVAALSLFCFEERAYYVYGMSRPLHRNKMPTYRLQWEAIRLAKAHGCTTYDLWGAPEVFDERDSMWGVYRFKRGWGGEVLRTLGAWDYPARPFWYRMYGEVLPRALEVLRRQAQSRRVAAE